MFESYSNLNTSLKYSKFQIITLFQNTVISPNFLVCEFCGKRVSPEFWANHSKLYGNCAFLQNFQTKKLSDILVFWAVFFTAVQRISMLFCLCALLIYGVIFAGKLVISILL